MFCYAVYTASHVINRRYIPHLKRLGLTYPQYITLTLLWERDGQKVTELAEKLRMNTSTLTPLLKRLERNGLVAKTRGRRDGREIFATLTPEGRVLQEEAADIIACLVHGTSMTQTELAELQRLLKKLSSNLST